MLPLRAAPAVRPATVPRTAACSAAAAAPLRAQPHAGRARARGASLRVRATPEEAMKDPAKAAAIKAQAEAMQKALESPQAQAQMAQMNSFLSNPDVQQRMAALQTDPEFKDFFDAIKTGGPQALMKFWNDDVMLAKISQRLGSAGGSPAGGAAAAAAAARVAPQAPPAEVTNLIEAARWGDLEAVEDFISIKRNVNEADKDGRTPLHFAVAYGKEEVGISIASALLEAGANVEAVDAKNNTALHYAAGYGRPEYCTLLLDAGASTAARNDTGKTPLDLAKLNGANPINAEPDVLKRLSGTGGFFQDV